MSFSSEDLAVVDRTMEVEIETQAPEGPVHRTVIWAVVDGADVFVRSVRGPSGRWFREAVANTAVALHAGGRRLAATAIDASDPDSVDRASAAFERKYAGRPGLPSMLRPRTLGTTLRLAPA